MNVQNCKNREILQIVPKLFRCKLGHNLSIAERCHVGFLIRVAILKKKQSIEYAIFAKLVSAQ